MKSKSIFLSNLHYFYAQTDGTYAFPNSAEGDLLKTAKKEIEGLETENYRLNQLLSGKNARRSMEEHISNEIVDGTYDPCPTDFDYETDFHHKLSTLMKQVDKLRQENSELKSGIKSALDALCDAAKFKHRIDILELENAKLKTLLNQIRNEPALWKKCGPAGRQDYYAGKPPFVPMIDAALKGVNK